MLLRILVEGTADEIVVVTVYKTSQINRYVRGVRQRRLLMIAKPIHLSSHCATNASVKVM